MEQKPLDNVNTEQTKISGSDITVIGKPDMWVLLCKASSASQEWMKSTKAMQVGDGCLVQVTTEFRDPLDLKYVSACAEAIQYVPGVQIGKDAQGNPALISNWKAIDEALGEY